MSKIWNRISKFFVKLLYFSFNNEWFKISTVVIALSYLICLLFFTNSNITQAISLPYSISTGMYLAGWSYDTYRKEKRIELLEKQLNKDRCLVSKEYIKEDLADLMHEIWAKDILSDTDNSTEEQIQRAAQFYSSLSDADKEINRSKANKVIKLLEEYIY